MLACFGVSLHALDLCHVCRVCVGSHVDMTADTHTHTTHVTQICFGMAFDGCAFPQHVYTHMDEQETHTRTCAAGNECLM